MENPLANFRFARFSFHLEALESLLLPPYKGSTLRGAFGHTFKKIACVNRQRVCSECLLKGKCIYSYVFETPPPSDTSKMRKYPYAPHPFVICPPLEEKTHYERGECLCFELTLIGKAIDYLPYFVFTFDELGKSGLGKGKGKCELVEVMGIPAREAESEQGDTGKVEKGNRWLEPVEQIYASRDKTLRGDFHVLTGSSLGFEDLSPTRLDLFFLTPTRLKFDGRLSPKLEFHVLIRNLLRRISLLAYFHCDFELEVEFRDLIERARAVRVADEKLSWVDWERYSQRQATKMKMGGVKGEIAFHGEMAPFLYYLLLGEQIHVGKGTSFGLGKYNIVRKGRSLT